MYNWSTNTNKLRQNKEQYNLWRLENLINFGLNNEKLNKVSLKKNLSKLNLDQKKRSFLKFLLN